MKTRLGFVSNSSSASFAILKKFLTDFQMEAIRNHIRFANGDFTPLEIIAIEALSPGLAARMHTRGDDDPYYSGDAWAIHERVCPETGAWIGADTDMDNFDFHWFLGELGIPDKHIQSAWSWEGEDW